MAKMKNKNRFGEENVEKLVREYWKMLEPEKDSENEVSGESRKMDSSAEPGAKQPL